MGIKKKKEGIFSENNTPKVLRGSSDYFRGQQGRQPALSEFFVLGKDLVGKVNCVLLKYNFYSSNLAHFPIHFLLAWWSQCCCLEFRLTLENRLNYVTDVCEKVTISRGIMDESFMNGQNFSIWLHYENVIMHSLFLYPWNYFWR